jgi:hypothetical protein
MRNIIKQGLTSRSFIVRNPRVSDEVVDGEVLTLAQPIPDATLRCSQDSEFSTVQIGR